MSQPVTLKPPTHLIVYLDAGDGRRVPLAEGEDADKRAQEIMAKGFRVWDPATRTSRHFPPHRINLIEGVWGEVPEEPPAWAVR